MNGVVLKKICIQGIQYPSVSISIYPICFSPRRRIYPGEAFHRSRGCRIWQVMASQSKSVSQSVQTTLKFNSFINSVPYGGFISSGMVWQGYCFHCVITTDGFGWLWLVCDNLTVIIVQAAGKKDSWLLVSQSFTESVSAAWPSSCRSQWLLSQSDWVGLTVHAGQSSCLSHPPRFSAVWKTTTHIMSISNKSMPGAVSAAVAVARLVNPRRRRKGQCNAGRHKWLTVETRRDWPADESVSRTAWQTQWRSVSLSATDLSQCTAGLPGVSQPFLSRGKSLCGLIVRGRIPLTPVAAEWPRDCL